MENTKKKLNLYERFREIPDFRRKQGQMHDHAFVFTIVTMAIMSGYNGQRPTGDFVERNKKELIKYFKPKKNLLPSFPTIARIMQKTDFNEVKKVFNDWAKDYADIPEQEWLSIDGKALRGTVKDSNNEYQNYVSLVSFFYNKTRKIVAVEKVENKKISEIVAVRDLIEALDLKGFVITLDALHCQEETIKKIVESENDYVIGVKKTKKNYIKK